MRRSAPILAVLAVAALLHPAPASALTSATVTLTASPNPSVTTATFKVVVKLSGPATGIAFFLEASNSFGGPLTCLPTPNCDVRDPAANPHWSWASASGTLTGTFESTVRPGMEVRFFAEGGISPTSNPVVRMKDPTVSSKLTRSPTGVIMPGDTLHLTVSATTNAGPMDDDLQVRLPDGVSAPFNLPAGAVYSPAPYHYVDRETILDRSASYSFDVQVTAPVGTKLVFIARFGSGSNLWDPGTKLTLTVGVAPTPRPTATPRATPRATSRPTATSGPSPGATAAPASGAPSSLPLTTPAAAASLAASPPSPSDLPSGGSPANGAAATEPPGAAPTASDGGPGGLLSVILLIVVVGMAALGAVRAVRSRSVRRPGT